MNQITHAAAVEALRTIFDDVTVESLTPDDIFQKTGRDLTKAEKNKKWLQNRLTPLKRYDLVESTYKGPGKTVDKIRLTSEGRKTLEGRVDNDESLAQEVRLESIVRDIKEFERQNPSLKVQFAVTRREESLTA